MPIEFAWLKPEDDYSTNCTSTCTALCEQYSTVRVLVQPQIALARTRFGVTDCACVRTVRSSGWLDDRLSTAASSCSTVRMLVVGSKYVVRSMQYAVVSTEYAVVSTQQVVRSRQQLVRSTYLLQRAHHSHRTGDNLRCSKNITVVLDQIMLAKLANQLTVT